MSKKVPSFICTHCGTLHNKWKGQCDECHAWNSVTSYEPTTNLKHETVELISIESAIDTTPYSVTLTNIPELDRVLGNGCVEGGCILLSGDPGIGKSTLLLQCSFELAKQNHQVYYFSAEESIKQIQLRARRLDTLHSNIRLASTDQLEGILATLEKAKLSQSLPKLVIIDSIQTIYSTQLESSAGSVGQVKYCSQKLIQFIKGTPSTLVMVGHISKEGNIAGPKVLEHMVDTVIQFEGDNLYRFRMLRCKKNRFGSTDEMGLFEMQEKGLFSVHNPATAFIKDRDKRVIGSIVYPSIEGSRPILLEIQSLITTSSPHAAPKRIIVGLEPPRVNMLIAILEARYQLKLSAMDIYINVSGGFKINDTAVDLAVVASLLSSYTNKLLDDDYIVFGEVALSGEIRPVSQNDLRIKEAEKLGYQKALSPNHTHSKHQMTVKGLHKLDYLVNKFVDKKI